MLRKPELSTGPMGHLGPYKGFTVLCWFFFATILSSRDSLIQTVSFDLCIFIHGSSSIHSSDFLNMKQTFSALSRSTAPGNSGNCIPFEQFKFKSKLSSVQSSGSTTLSSWDSTQQLITGLTACQRSIKELLQTVRHSNKRIEELADKVDTLDSKLERAFFRSRRWN